MSRVDQPSGADRNGQRFKKLTAKKVWSKRCKLREMKVMYSRPTKSRWVEGLVASIAGFIGNGIPGSSKRVKFVPFHPKNLPKRRNFTYMEDPGICHMWICCLSSGMCVIRMVFHGFVPPRHVQWDKASLLAPRSKGGLGVCVHLTRENDEKMWMFPKIGVPPNHPF